VVLENAFLQRLEEFWEDPQGEEPYCVCWGGGLVCVMFVHVLVVLYV